MALQVDECLRSKFTSRDLYRWMSTQLGSIHYRAYQPAHELAKRAERCFEYELGAPPTSQIKSGYWDSQRKGLLAGERLYQDLKRLETAYLEGNKRGYEITTHVSLLQLDPRALLALRETGRCEFEIPEDYFDRDCPGHFMRRIQSIGVSVPCVTGSYTGVHCTLTIYKSVVRRSSSAEAYGPPDPEDQRKFLVDFSRIQSVVTSSGQSDSGMFEPSLRDERYLPFETSGVISEWRLQLPADPGKQEPAQFDYANISDVILHLRYTAREGGALLRSRADAQLQEAIGDASAPGCVRIFSVRHEFPTEWARSTARRRNRG
jgi:hypothetical protein